LDILIITQKIKLAELQSGATPGQQRNSSSSYNLAYTAVLSPRGVWWA